VCGVAAVIGVRDAERVAADMSRALAHRGPDDHGIRRLAGRDGVALGALAHRRLSILDLTSAGHQPMVSSNGRYVVAFNGEIYNFRGLRSELERAGSRFTSDGDTAVLLEGWVRFGPAFVHRLDGMFAFALWDEWNRSLYLGRDVFGMKPLYYAPVGRGVLVASELRGIIASGVFPPRIDPRALAGYLTFGSVPEPETILAGVRLAPPGVVLRFDAGTASLKAVESVPLVQVDSEQDPVSDHETAVAMVREALERSVDRHLVSDVPVALFLSGGIDSSIIAALAAHAARRAGSTLDGFTVTFSERRFDESHVANVVARRHGIRHHLIPLGDDDLLAALPRAFAGMDQPTLDGINTYVVSEAVRAHGTKVVLSGLGGDELFAGYPSFSRARLLSRYALIPAPARRVAAHVAATVGGVRGAKVALGLRHRSPGDAAYLASRTVFGSRQVSDLCGARALATEGAPRELSVLQQVSWRELTGYMRNTLLRDSDVFSMAHALELRVPFLDREVVTAAFQVADALKLSRRVAKPLLVNATRDLLPAEVWNRPKQGFVLPFASWMHGALAAEVTATLGDVDRVHALGLNAAAVRDVWSGFIRGQGGVTWSRPWALYALLRWAAAQGIVVAEAAEPDAAEAAAQ
jgi:asparagine synthase (glutamine-hydrolysing)